MASKLRERHVTQGQLASLRRQRGRLSTICCQLLAYVDYLEAERAAQAFADTVQRNRTCDWAFDDKHCKYDTGCGNAHQFTVDGPKENNHKFCPYCGRKIREC